MTHIKEKGRKYLIRIKDYATSSSPSGILHGLKLPDTDEFDTLIDLNLTRKQSNEVEELLKDKNHYKLSNIIIEKKDRKYAYKVNFSVAVHICHEILLGSVSPLDIEILIARYITPIRPGRSRPRNMTAKTIINFMYRVA